MALVAVAAFHFGRTPGEMRDFEVYWTAASRAAAAQPLYRVDDGHYQFKYLPAFAVLTAPASAASLETAKRAWFVASVALLCGLLSLSLSLLPHQRRTSALLIAATLVVMGKFYGHELVLGQVNLLFALLAAAAILMIATGDVTAGCLLMVAAAVVKPYAVLFLPWLVMLKGARALISVLIGTALVIGTPVALYGVEGTIGLHQQWWRTVFESTAPNLINPDNVSLAGFFAKWFGQGAAATAMTVISSAICVGLAGLTMLRGRRMPRREALEGSLLLILIPLLSPQGWDYVFLVATPAVVLLVNYARDLPATFRGVLYGAMGTVGLSLFDLMGRERYAAFMGWSVITVCFVVLLLALVVLRRRGIA